MDGDIHRVKQACVVTCQRLQEPEDHIAGKAKIFRGDLKQQQWLDSHEIKPLQDDVIVRDEAVVERGYIRDNSQGERPKGKKGLECVL